MAAALRRHPATAASAGLATTLALYGAARFGLEAGLRIAAAGALFALLNLAADRRRPGWAGHVIAVFAPMAQAIVIVGVILAPAPFGFGSDLYAPMLVGLPFALLLLCFAAANLSATDPMRVLFAAVAALLGLIFAWWMSLSDPATISTTAPIVRHATTVHGALVLVGLPHYFNRSIAQNQVVLVAAIGAILALAAYRMRALADRAAAEEARRGALASHFSPQLIDTMMQSEGLPPQEKDVVVVDLDLVGFTALAEKLAPEHVAAGLRRYRQIVEDAVFAEGGALAALVGDGAVALFGLTGGEPVHRGIACALRVTEAWSAAGDMFGGEKPALAIGIDAGLATIGLVGGARSLSLLFLGKPVRGAENLQRATRAVGAPILVSPAVHDALGGAAPGVSLVPVETLAGPAWRLPTGP